MSPRDDGPSGLTPGRRSRGLGTPSRKGAVVAVGLRETRTPTVDSAPGLGGNPASPASSIGRALASKARGSRFESWAGCVGPGRLLWSAGMWFPSILRDVGSLHACSIINPAVTPPARPSSEGGSRARHWPLGPGGVRRALIVPSGGLGGTHKPHRHSWECARLKPGGGQVRLLGEALGYSGRSPVTGISVPVVKSTLTLSLLH